MEKTFAEFFGGIWMEIQMRSFQNISVMTLETLLFLKLCHYKSCQIS